MADHTPAPWRVDGALLKSADDEAVGHLASFDEADWSLIAAAPELLEALEFVRDRCDDTGWSGQDPAMVRSAIAKARGES